MQGIKMKAAALTSNFEVRHKKQWRRVRHVSVYGKVTTIHMEGATLTTGNEERIKSRHCDTTRDKLTQPHYRNGTTADNRADASHGDTIRSK